MNKTRLGMLTPSSNTVVEPVTSEIVRGLTGVTAHFSRLPVTEISLEPAALDQFAMAPFLSAAALLADAHMNVIAWNGTSAAWKGFAQDDALCEAIRERYAVPATTSMKAINTILAKTNVRRFALVTPYLDDVQRAIIENYTRAGFSVASERHSGIRVNFAFSEIAPDAIAAMVRGVASDAPQAIIIVCTNLSSAPLVEALERELGIPVYDSLSAVVWHSLRLAHTATMELDGWGSLFRSSMSLD